VMKPRTKKGPSWANDAEQLQSSASANFKAAPVNKNSVISEDPNIEIDGDVEQREGLSDLDWMKRRMTMNADSVEKAFEQSDDETMGDKNTKEV